MNNFTWENFNNPKLEELRKLCNLNELIANIDDEFEQQITLNNWVHNKLPLGGDYKDYSLLSSFDILEDLNKGSKFRCTQYTQLLLQCATALGWHCRKLGVDSDHAENEQDMHHGVNDIWSNKYNKWFLLDPMNNLYYEKNGIPLNSLEVRNEYIKNRAKDIKAIIGKNNESKNFQTDSKGFDTPSNYFWFYISERNNFFEKPGLFNIKAYLWIDEYNKGKKWYKNGTIHDMYGDRFTEISDEKFIYPKI